MFAKKLESISLIDEGKIKRVRGWVTSAKVAPQLTTRVIDKVREVFNDYIPDVWIHTDHYKKDFCGAQAGYSISLQAETSTGVALTKDCMFTADQFKMPEELGESTAHAMLDEIFNGGVVDTTNQTTLLLLTALSSGDNISQVKLCRVSQQSVQLLRHLKQFFNMQFRIKECEDDVFEDDSDEEEEKEEPKVQEIDSSSDENEAKLD